MPRECACGPGFGQRHCRSGCLPKWQIAWSPDWFRLQTAKEVDGSSAALCDARAEYRRCAGVCGPAATSGSYSRVIRQPPPLRFVARYPLELRAFQLMRLTWLLIFAERRLRPLARRFFNTLRPPLLFMRARNPCRRKRRFFLGWYVRLGILSSPKKTRAQGPQLLYT